MTMLGSWLSGGNGYITQQDVDAMHMFARWYVPHTAEWTLRWLPEQQLLEMRARVDEDISSLDDVYTLFHAIFGLIEAQQTDYTKVRRDHDMATDFYRREGPHVIVSAASVLEKTHYINLPSMDWKSLPYMFVRSG